jgi:PAS domain S-box-containing protein
MPKIPKVRKIPAKEPASEKSIQEKTVEELRKARESFQLVMDTIPQRLFWKDRDFRYLGCNRVFAEDAGLQSPEEIIGMNDFELSWRESAPLYRADDREVMEKDISKINYEEEQVREDGSRLWLRTTKLPIKNDRGEIVGVFGSYEDITREKLAEERTRFLELQLQQSQKMEALGTLAGGIAHDFNNILAAIVGYTQLVNDSLPEADQRREDLRHVLHASERGRQLIQRILSFSRSGQPESDFVSFEGVLGDTIEFLRATIPVTIKLKTKIEGEDSYIEGSEGDVHQLVVNLATNAAHAMEKTGGTLTITLSVADHKESIGYLLGSLPAGRYFHLHVADTGSGITHDNLSRIFDPFFTTKATGEGTGLGLSVVHGIVIRLGGAINVESEPGVGTRFDVYIPACERGVPSVQSENIPMSRGDESVLLVDDEVSLAELERRILEKVGYVVDAYSDPLEALEAFRSNPDGYDVLVTDLTMPELTGTELIREIRSIRKNLPVVLVSGFNESLTRETYTGQVAPVFVQKPILARNLSRSIRSAIDSAGPSK